MADKAIKHNTITTKDPTLPNSRIHALLGARILNFTRLSSDKLFIYLFIYLPQ